MTLRDLVSTSPMVHFQAKSQKNFGLGAKFFLSQNWFRCILSRSWKFILLFCWQKVNTTNLLFFAGFAGKFVCRWHFKVKFLLGLDESGDFFDQQVHLFGNCCCKSCSLHVEVFFNRFCQTLLLLDIISVSSAISMAFFCRVPCILCMVTGVNSILSNPDIYLSLYLPVASAMAFCEMPSLLLVV